MNTTDFPIIFLQQPLTTLVKLLWLDREDLTFEHIWRRGVRRWGDRENRGCRGWGGGRRKGTARQDCVICIISCCGRNTEKREEKKEILSTEERQDCVICIVLTELLNREGWAARRRRGTGRQDWSGSDKEWDQTHVQNTIILKKKILKNWKFSAQN